MLSIDGSAGEGGGQILRTALACSLLTGVPFNIERIRARRRKPGLLPQHLSSVRAAAEIANARTTGATLGSDALTFEPGEVRAGEYRFDIGTAGSTGLVLQTVLVPLLTAGGESEVTVTGGTHNEGAPPFEFLDLSFASVLRRMGADLSLSMESPGFYPIGGGQVRARVGDATWKSVDLTERGPIRSVWAQAVVSRLPLSIAERELAVVADALDWPKETLKACEVDAGGPGNAITLVIESEPVTAVFTGFGRRGRPAEVVAADATAEAQDYLVSGAPVDPHLADQLLIPLTQCETGWFLASHISDHFTTNVGVIARFFQLEISMSRTEGNTMVECRSAET